MDVPTNPQLSPLPKTASACLQMLAAQMAEDKAARRLVLSVILALKEYGIVCAKYLTTWYAQRFGRQNPDEEPNLRKLALKAVFDIAITILDRDELVAENMWFTPKVQQMLSLIGVMSQHRAGLVIFVKKRSSAYCLHHAACEFFDDLKAGSLVGFNALSKKFQDDQPTILEAMKKGDLDILFTTTVRPVISLQLARHTAVLPFDPLPEGQKFLDDLRALENRHITGNPHMHADTAPNAEKDHIHVRVALQTDASIWGSWPAPNQSGDITCQIYHIQFVGEDYTNNHIGLLLPRRLPHVDSFNVFPSVDGDHKRISVHTIHLGEISLTPSRADLICRFQQWTQTMFDGFDVNGPTRSDVLAGLPFVQHNLYYFIPLDASGRKICWDAMRTVVSRGSYFTPRSIINRAADNTWQLPTDFQNLVVLCSHTRRLARVRQFHTEITLDSAHVSYKGTEISLKEFYSIRWNLQDLDGDQPLVELQDLRLKLRNVLAPSGICHHEDSDSDPDEVEHKDDRVKLPETDRDRFILRSLIPCQLANEHGISWMFYDAVQWTPCILHRLANWVKADRLRARFGFRSTKLVLEALTAPSTHEEFHYERSELLGDAFLKLAAGLFVFATRPLDNEGALTTERSNIVRNTTLASICKSSGLINHLLLDSFQPNARKPPTRLTLDGTNKTSADAVEAMIGAALRDQGPDAAMRMLCWLGLDLRVDQLPRYFDNFTMDVARGQKLYELELKLGYHFSDLGLLHRALSHGSALPSAHERLEFLGDAVIDYLITEEFMHRTDFRMTQGQYTRARAHVVNNASFARIAVSQLSLQNYIIHRSATLAAQFSNPSLSDNLSDMYLIPDVLSDAFEAMVGAIFVDNNRNFEETWNVLQPIVVQRIEEALYAIENEPALSDGGN